MKAKSTLEELLASEGEKKILFLGREEIFTHKEIARFLKKYQAGMTLDHEEGLSATIEHAKLNPVEEDISNSVYEEGIPNYPLRVLEKLISETMNDDELLMGIKLANDQDRIFRLLGNAQFSDALFVKLLGLYEWDDEEDDSRDDRDVIMYTLRRYIDIKPNEQDLLYSYLTLRRLATEATDAQLLLALTGFPNFEFLIRGREKVSLRETIARNLNINEELVKKLVSFKDSKVNSALSGNPSVPLAVLKQLMQNGESSLYKALAVNGSIDNEIFDALLKKEDEVAALLLLHQPIDSERFSQIEKRALDESIFSIIGANAHLTNEVVEKLLETENDAILEMLSENSTLTADVLEVIYQMDRPSTIVHLAKNRLTNVWILQAIYDESSKSEEILAALAQNSSTPERILRILFEKDVLAINKGLATNASLPMEMLDVLKVDTRLQNYLSQNKVFIEAYETVLDYDKNAVQF